MDSAFTCDGPASARGPLAERGVKRRGDRKTGLQQSLLLHVCCAPCAAGVIDVLGEEFELTVFFYNPNICPPGEHFRRADQVRRLCRQLGVQIIAGEYDAHCWSRRMRGRGADREGGLHCAVCFQIRLAQTAAVAQERGFDYFATTLTISPHKNARIINRVGQRVARELRTKFYPADFKKGDGFKKSCQLSRKYGFYRQDYCGCIYSLGEREESKAGRSDSTRAGARGDV